MAPVAARLSQTGTSRAAQPDAGYHEWMVRILQPRPRPAWQIVAPGALLLAAFLVTAVLILASQGDPPFNGLDTMWQAYVFILHSPFWDQVNAVLNGVGYVGMLILQGLLAVALLVLRRPWTALFTVVASLSALALTQLAKAVVGRHRPEGAKVLTDTGSYPSGHVSATTTSLVIIALLIGRYWTRLLALVGIAAMMVSRTYLSAHWLSDVLGAFCLAAGIVLLVWWPFRNVCIRENESAGPTLRAGAWQRRQGAGQQE